ncbi:hypothetical protein [Paenibacillus harenae]|uniref:hypothetical protein n=1 Tax=Paenibacillus harenae TaxID=306543 RepID=UPI000406D6D6|nr:hypothetical protein [Paenibacillus harenae]
MYGADRMNPYLHLKYGLTREFFEAFRGLTYRGIELPLVLMRNFHSYTKAQLLKKLRHSLYVRQKIKQHRFRSIADVQQKLVRWPRPARPLKRERGRNRILLPGRLVFLAKKQFPKHRVILTVSNRIDWDAVKKTKLPKRFEIYRFDSRMRRTSVPLRTRRRLRREIHRICRLKRRHEVFGKTGFPRWLYAQCLTAVKQIHAADALLRRKPVRVVLDYDTSVVPGEALSLLARRYRLPYVYLQYHMPMIAPLLPFRAAYYCMWGKNYREWLQNKGVPAARIREIGSIRFEEAFKGSWKSPQWLRSKWGIPEQQLIIGYTTQTAKWMNDLFLKWLLAAIKDLPVTLVIKRHPKDKQTYRRIAAGHPNVIVFPAKHHLYDLLNGIDVLATVSSTTAVEAAMFGKGILVLQTDFPTDYYGCLSILSRSKAGYIATEPQQLEAYLRELIESEDSRRDLAAIGQQFLAETLHQGGSPRKRVRSLVASLLRT